MRSQRLRRQLNEICKTLKGDSKHFIWVDQLDDLPATGQVMLFNGKFVFENRTIEGVIATPNCVLQHEGQIAAAFIDAEEAGTVINNMRDQGQALPDNLKTISPNDLKAFDTNLRRSTKPLLEPISPDAQRRTGKQVVRQRLPGNYRPGDQIRLAQAGETGGTSVRQFGGYSQYGHDDRIATGHSRFFPVSSRILCLGAAGRLDHDLS